MNQLLIDVSNILNQLGEEIELEGEKDFPAVLTSFREIRFTQPVKFKIKVRNVGSGLLVDGAFVASISFPCSRCLERFSYISRTTFEELFRFETNDLEIVDGSSDVGPLAEQSIVMNLPVKTLCAESCLGLCPQCGVNLNQEKCGCIRNQLDPRLSKLKDLLKK